MSQNILRISYDSHNKQRLFFLYVIYQLVLVMGMMQYKDMSVLKKWLCVEWTLKIETASSSKMSVTILFYHVKFEVSIAVLLKIQVLLDVMGNTNPVTKTMSCQRQHESTT
jgi:hypothetical protein